MNQPFAGALAGALVAGLMLLSGCTASPAQQSAAARAAAPALMDIAQLPGLETPVYVSGSAAAAAAAAPAAGERANRSMQQQTEGMAPGAVAAGPKPPLPAAEPQAAPPAKPVLVVRALAPDAPIVLPDEESWKKPLPPPPSLEGR